MTKPSKGISVFVILGNLGWPIIWGLAACAGFYALVQQGVISSPLVSRYFAGHIVEYIETALFCVGLSALTLKLLNVLGQTNSVGLITLGPRGDRALKPQQSADFLDQLDRLSSRLKNSYFGRRLRSALLSVERKGSADDLDEELKYLSDIESGRQHDSFSLVRIMIWAIPMLGFLGTVVGITMALGNLSPTALVNSPQDAMKGLLAGLSVAFDTTALALSLSIILMFCQFLIDRIEVQLLDAVDRRADEELVGRFEQFGGGSDPQVASIQRMSQAVVEATQHLVHQQADLWKSTIDSSHQQWSRLVGDSGEQIQTALANALDQSLQKHAFHLAKTEQAASEQVRQRWEQWQVSLSDNARIMHDQQKELQRQGEIMGRVMAATGEVANLENRLNENLQSLAGSKNFEDTVMSLSAAIHLLNTRLGEPARGSEKVDLSKSSTKDRAA